MTIQDIEERKVKLEGELTTALEAAKVLTPATAEFDEAYGRYLTAKSAIDKIPDEIAKVKQSENAEAIKTAGITVGEAIIQLIDGLKVAELIGVPVNALRFYNTPSKDEAGVETMSMGVVFNPVAATRKAGTGTGGKKGGGRTVIVAPDGDKFSLTKFVLAHATDAEKESPEYKYPHTRVDTKPKFEEFCSTHTLTGYAYETPSAETDSAEAAS